MSAGAVLLMLVCGFDAARGQWTQDCIAWREHVASVAECKERADEIRRVLPANMRASFPECVRERVTR